MESKTAMHELLDKFNSTCTLKEFFNHVYNNQQILLAKTNQEIIDAYDEGKYLSSGKNFNGETYYNNTYGKYK